MSKFFYVFRLLSLLGGFLLIFILPFLKIEQWKIGKFSPPTWISIALVAISLLSLVITGIVYGLHKKIKIPKTSDGTKKWFKRLCFITIVVGVWWFWYPLKKLMPPTFKEKPGIEHKTTTDDSKKKVVGVEKEIEKEKKIFYYLKWEKPKNSGKKYLNLSNEEFEVVFSEESDENIKLTIKNHSRDSDETFCSLQPSNKRESCGMWNKKEIYNESNTVWTWKGSYKKIHTGETGTVYLRKNQSGDAVYTGKISLPNYRDEWINLVIYRKKR